MAVIYGYERFNYPTTKLVQCSAAVTGGVGGTNNPGYTETSKLGSKDVGCIIKYNNSTKVAAVLANKSAVEWKEANTTYYLLAEIPVPADNTDYCFVGVILRDQGMVDNLVPRNPQQNWANQFANLSSGGIK
jgi:hypothetical protein